MTPEEKKALHDAIIEALRPVHDPEIRIGIVDLGLIYDVDINDDAEVKIKMTPVKDEYDKVVRAKMAISDDGDRESAAIGELAMKEAQRGYTEEMEHWAWCIKNPAPENQPRCKPEVALGDAVIALTSNMAAREERRIEFQKEWFQVDDPLTPEGLTPDPNDRSRYG